MDTLIRAATLSEDPFPELHVAIGGSGRDEKRLCALPTRLGAPVMFLGRVPDDVLPRVARGSSDLMVMDCRSRWFGLEQEGFGIVFVEAAATGIAQIAGRSGGMTRPCKTASPVSSSPTRAATTCSRRPFGP